jgi:hypothetical protein
MKRGGYLELEVPTLREELKEEYQCYALGVRSKESKIQKMKT